MAGVQERGGSYRVYFRYQGKQVTFPLGKVTKEEAEAKAAQAEYLLLRLRQRLIELPPGVNIADFLQHDGKAPVGSVPATKPARLADLRDRFLSTHAGAHEKNTLYTAKIHFGHLGKTLGEKFPLAELTQADLQRHVDRRTGESIAPVTIKKEINGLRAAWNWARRLGLVAVEWPGKGLVYQKTKEKPPFQTREQIERKIAWGGLTDDQRGELWESLYLTAEELSAFLGYASGAARHPFIYPMLCMASHTGARRSELMRAEVSDVDFDAQVVTIREKKRVRGRQTTRHVPLSPFLAGVLKDWLAAHPGGNHLFCHDGEVERSKKRSRKTGYLNGKGRPTTDKGRLAGLKDREQPGFASITENEAADHFMRTVKGSEWEAGPARIAVRPGQSGATGLASISLIRSS